MARTYAIPDIHGRLDLLDAALEMINVHSGEEPATIIALGDYVDRGPDSCLVVERLMNWQSSKLDLICLKGNHEWMMGAVCNNLAERGWWEANGGGATLASYGGLAGNCLGQQLVPQAHLRWLADLPFMHVDEHRVFVHAAVDPMVPLDQQNERTLLWKRYPEGSSVGHGRRHVVHGHDAHLRAPIVTTGRTNLDAMAWKTGRLVIGVFEDERPGGAREFLEVVGLATE
ncbi:MAG: serine/threonine protein phosphatase [Bradyrhizobium sp.]|uniref:metallophosphoesterase n=1 Tax=Bradyrhizobium sp. TaxID=376 RepID=UPI0025B950AA|nr:metallophosphoesterase [Bradyrhizobium sp.]MBI5263414.1 serine/threonine protein phosphatase [Bradyrhizobium sp.]